MRIELIRFSFWFNRLLSRVATSPSCSLVRPTEPIAFDNSACMSRTIVIESGAVSPLNVSPGTICLPGPPPGTGFPGWASACTGINIARPPSPGPRFAPVGWAAASLPAAGPRRRSPA